MSEIDSVLVRARFAPPDALREDHVFMGAGRPPTVVLRFTMEGGEQVLSIAAGGDGVGDMEGVSEALDYAIEIVTNAVNKLNGETND